MNEKESYEFMTFNDEFTHRFKVLAGSEDYVRQRTNEILAEMPQEFALYQNYPNPFNPTTTIRFAMPWASPVSLVIYNMLGQEVKTLIDDSIVTPGEHTVLWNGLDNQGRLASTGLYIYQLRAQDFVQSKKMMVVK